MILKKTSKNYSIMHSVEKLWKMFVIEKSRIYKKDDTDKTIKQQTKLTFKGIHE